MAEKIIIVESPKKAREIQKFLGKGYTVKATIGHFKDLPEKEMGVDLSTFEPSFVVKSKNHKKILSEIKKLAKQAKEIYIATDPDREGYAIGYFMFQELKKTAKDKPIKRAEFHEITQKHVKEVLKKAPEFEKTNKGLFNAFLGRRVGDRIVGYTLSPIASKEIGGRFSVGRVQSPAVRLIVEREEEIKNFKPEPYYVISAVLEKEKKQFTASYKEQKLKDKQKAQKIYEDIKKVDYAVVKSIERKQVKQSPKPPFVTSTLQQTANSVLKFAPEKTMMLAQDLFENGLITYHRTDSVRISDEAVKEIRKFIKEKLGNEYLPQKPRKYKNKNTQADAHEAIRITNFVDLEAQKKLVQEKGLTEDHFKLLKLIYERTIASQMKDALYDRTTVLFDINGHPFKTTGSVLIFEGYKKIYKQQEQEQEDSILPPMEEGEKVKKVKEKLEEKFTKPPPRYTEGSLVKKLEELGIGRPSTYATIIKTIKDRGYVIKQSGSLRPTESAYNLINYLNRRYNWVIDYDFTRKMEEFLDKVEENKKNWKEFVKELYEKSQKKSGSAISEKMRNYALDLAKKHGKDISDIIDDPKKLKEFIDQHKDTKPTEKQISYAKALSEKTGIELPEEVLQDKEKIKKWINKAKKEALKHIQLSDKQKKILISQGKEELINQPEKALKWLDSYFKKRKKR